MYKLIILLIIFPLYNLYPQNQEVKIQNSPSAQDEQYLYISSINIEGNKISKKKIILRELTFSVGDTIKKSLLNKIIEQSKENLINTFLFNFVFIDTIIYNSNQLQIRIRLIERWYIWPFPVFSFADPNFNVWWLRKDFSRTNYGFYILNENFRGRNEKLRFKFQWGYEREVGIQYKIPYFNKKQLQGFSISSIYSSRHEFNYKTVNNKRILFKDENKPVINIFNSSLIYNLRKKHLWEIKYNYVSISDTAKKISDNFLENNKEESQFFSFNYSFINDKRDYKSYPLKGHYLKLSATKYGLGLINQDLNLLYFLVEFKKYFQLGEKTFFATSVKSKIFTNKNIPYYYQRALGYRDYVRAYEYYIFDGQSFFLAKTGIKRLLFTKEIFKLPFIPIENFNTLFYSIFLRAFADLAYVYDKQYYELNPNNNTWLFGTGAGMDFVTFYDIIIRIEYSINKFGEKGVFLHFVAPI